MRPDTCTLQCDYVTHLGVKNGPLKFLTARKILPLLNLLAKFKRVLACSCSPNFCVARKLSKEIFFISARARKKIAVLGMLANARKDHSSPLHLTLTAQLGLIRSSHIGLSKLISSTTFTCKMLSCFY